MKAIPWATALLGALALAAVGTTACGGEDAEQARETASEAGAKAREAAEDVGAAAERMADEAGRAAERAGEEMERAADEMPGQADAVARCKELAAQEAWAEALEPCTAAHAARPDDMAIEHALQQAKAATGS